MYPSIHGTRSVPFVQLRGHFRCRRANLQLVVSNQRGFFCPCRDPRCSFQCHRAHGFKQAAILADFLLGLPADHVVFKGCLKFDSDISKDDMSVTQTRFTRVLRETSKQRKITLKFRGFAHDTGLYRRHFDYLAFSDAAFDPASEVFKNAARNAGLAYASTKEIVDRGAIKSAARYLFKVDERPEQEAVFVFLPDRDGTRLVWGSQRFFSPTTAEAIWKKLRGDWYDAPSETLTKKVTDEVLLQPYLPCRADEAITPEAIQWLLSWPMSIEDVKKVLHDMPGVQGRDGRYWLNVPPATHPRANAKGSFISKVLGNRIPYHADFFPLPSSVEENTYEWPG